MKIETVKIDTLKLNQDNPRFIKDHKFDKLVQSIKDLPQMLEIRPIVVNEDNVVLGGNMRLKACKEAGLKEVPVIKASALSPEQQREFIIKDNVGFGEWDWEIIANQWDIEMLEEMGLSVPIDPEDITEMKNPENSETENIFATELDQESQYIVLMFKSDIDWIQAKSLFGLESTASRRANGKEWSKGTGRVIDGPKAIKQIRDGN